MMKMTLRTIAVASFAVFLYGCDSPQEEQREHALEQKADSLENAADATREQGEAQADAIERTDPGLDSPPTDRAAEAVRDGSEVKADTLEESADQVRENK